MVQIGMDVGSLTRKWREETNCGENEYSEQENLEDTDMLRKLAKLPAKQPDNICESIVDGPTICDNCQYFNECEKMQGSFVYGRCLKIEGTGDKPSETPPCLWKDGMMIEIRYIIGDTTHAMGLNIYPGMSRIDAELHAGYVLKMLKDKVMEEIARHYEGVRG
jgi:hypothetical protein